MTLLAGCGKPISAQRTFDGRHVWDMRRTPLLRSLNKATYSFVVHETAPESVDLSIC